ncbi:integrin alpha-PS3-like [Anopheles bellator]|uniref:integrin alpha-PS3-like n=1 Tax=Anopheles bellator TaxID=139047 RepID=UPI0026489ACD|nr:integrin alpha-PS3-like [Anopheles bellator]
MVTINHLIVFSLALHSLHIVHGFNLSPEPNYVFQKPLVKTFKEQTRSSYFGFSISLRKSGVLVGAPRAQSDLESQRNINEIGTIFRCNFTQTSPCWQYRFDRQGNTNYEEHFDEIRSERKDYQMFGASVDGLASDQDWFVACAPKAIGDLEVSYLLHGACYLSGDTVALDEPTNLHKIKPLRYMSKQQYRTNNTTRMYNYMFGELGFSVHIPDSGREILIGAPGVMHWRGTVMRYRQRPRHLSKDAPWHWRNVYFEPNGGKFSTTPFFHESTVPNPLHLKSLKANSYFGYAVNSGRFLRNRTILYVASAPQARQQLGEVIIFDYINVSAQNETAMRQHRSFVGQQTGEYFGYALSTEDFNGDGLADLAVGAPMHSRTMEHENGVVYVFLNQDGLNFELQTTLSTPFELSGRYGTSLGRIGDINRDGYGDIAVGAPFEDDGVVYIHLGSASGITSKASQRLTSPKTNPLNPSSRSFFGYAFSRGVDFDGNGYNDLAIGAPNSDSVYVYRTYPVVRVIPSINSTAHELAVEGGSIEICVSWSRYFPIEASYDITVEYILTVDSLLGRATIDSNGANVYEDAVTIGEHPVCQEHDVSVKASQNTIFQPVTIEIEFSLHKLSLPPKGDRFCKHCALLDPSASNKVIERISFTTGCAKDVCLSDLKLISLKWKDIALPYVIGSTSTATLEIEIGNTAESAYLPQLNVTIPTYLKLAKLLPGCNIIESGSNQSGIVCDLNGRFPLKQSSIIKHTLTFDMTQLGGMNSLEVRAKVITISDERSPADNEMKEVLILQEVCDVEIISETSTREVHLDQQNGVLNVTHRVSLHNNGPSAMHDALLHVDIPLVYVSNASGKEKRCQIITLDSIGIQGSYDGNAMSFEGYDPVTPLSLDTPLTEGVLNSNGTSTNPDSERFSDEILSLEQTLEMSYARPKRSNLWIPPRPQGLSSEETLPPNRTIFFNCSYSTVQIECIQLNASVGPFRSNRAPILVELRYNMDLNAIDACLEGKKNIFVTQIVTDLHKDTGNAGTTFQISRNNPKTVVYKNVNPGTPIWIYVSSSLGGLFILMLMSYAMYRTGFFERTMRQELRKRHRESKFIDITEDLEDSF